MEPGTVALIFIGGLAVLLAGGMHIGFAMALAGLGGTMMLLSPEAALSLFGLTVFETALSFEFIVIPLFVLMGHFATAGGLSQDLYKAFNVWLGNLPGGLGLATIGSCGAFAAICGSSLATAAAMSKVALPEMQRYKYDPRLATGSIAAGGTLGILIPPSVIMVLYGILTETNVADLFIAGIIPGVLLVVFFMATIWLLANFNPNLGPRGPKSSIKEKLTAFRNVWGTLLLFTVVLGGIYTGIFTPTEAAGIGAFGALGLGILAGKMTKASCVQALLDSVDTTAMVFTILIGAIVFKNLIALLRFPEMIESWMLDLSLSPMGILVVILIIYILLGAILDTMAMILLTLPVFFPIISTLGFDPVWFGVLMVIVIELALITPPMGINVFVIKGMVSDVSLGQIYIGVIPFVIAQIILLIIIVLFPDLALWLPNTSS
ncbi:MAG: TRAP transporter large permease [Pseudomonadota bacterium]|nr:TRAP transporter large permease [Pseudomonadota bacterium]